MNIIALALFALSTAAPQTPDAPNWTPRELPAHLASEDATQVAWAAYLVQRNRVVAAVPSVRRALARLAGEDDVQGKMARLHLLDALIQLDVRVPGEEVLPHAVDNLRVPALILAAKAPEVNSTYFATRFTALADSPDIEWQVCGNILTSLREEGFALSCLQAFRVALHIEVTDDKPCRMGAC